MCGAESNEQRNVSFTKQTWSSDTNVASWIIKSKANENWLLVSRQPFFKIWWWFFFIIHYSLFSNRKNCNPFLPGRKEGFFKPENPQQFHWNDIFTDFQCFFSAFSSRFEHDRIQGNDSGGIYNYNFFYIK